MSKQIKMYFPADNTGGTVDDTGTNGGGMDGGGTDGATGVNDTGGAGDDDLEDAVDDGSDVGIDTDLGTSDDLGTGGDFGTGTGDTGNTDDDTAARMADMDPTLGTGMLEDDAPSG